MQGNASGKLTAQQKSNDGKGESRESSEVKSNGAEGDRLSPKY